MKTTLLALFLVLLGLNSQTLHAQEADACKVAISNHLKEMDESETLIKKIRTHSKDITSFEIVLFQKNMTSRYASLKRLQNLYKDRECSPKVMADAITIFDFSLVGKSVFEDSTLRRVFMGFAKYPLYNLTDYVRDYKEFTSKAFVESTLVELALSQTELPEGIEVSPTDKEYDPNLYALSDSAIKATTSVVAGAARVWGFISDHLKWRQGRIKNNDEALTTIKQALQPLDLVFETRKFTLSNLTIPGHWGHLGIWLGTKEQLITLGIWDQEYFAPFRAHVEAGHNIMEIRKEGLQYQGLDTFINLDEIAVTRMKGITANAAEIFKNLNEQADKKYDFKFDARSADKITCAELITYSYGDYKWPQTKTLFQVSIRPDDIALMTIDAAQPAQMILYYKGIKKKDGGGFEVMSEAEWKKVLGFKTPEELAEEAAEKERKKGIQRRAEELKDSRGLYGGA